MLFMTAIRIIAMSGKYLFVLYAARHMGDRDFGRYGLVVALTVIIVAIVAFESYQIFVRDIAQTNGAMIRRTYGLYTLMGLFVSALLAYLTILILGWGQSLALLTAPLLATEYLGTESYRMLIAESRPFIATVSLSLRNGLWALLLPAATLAGLLPNTWSLSLVVGTWLCCNFVALIPFMAVVSRYMPNRESLKCFVPEMRIVFTNVVPWVITIVASRALEFGGRFVLAAVASESISGRFTLVSMLASLSYVGYKGVLEPTYFMKLSGSTWREYRGTFRNELILFVVVGSVGSIIAALFFTRLPGKTLTVNELYALAIMIATYALFCLSYLPHFTLYREKKDWQVTVSTALAAVVGVLTALVLGWGYGLVGTTVGVFFGAVCLWAFKEYLAIHARGPQLEIEDLNLQSGPYGPAETGKSKS
jgi:O-antigen/teichoic acid export membrane protein